MGKNDPEMSVCLFIDCRFLMAFDPLLHPPARPDLDGLLLAPHYSRLGFFLREGDIPNFTPPDA